jgi:thiamine-phosphate pyrophosphorylase
VPETDAIPKLRYAITDRSRFSGDEQERQAELVRHTAQWTADGIDFIQLREKDLEAGALADLGRRMLATLRAHDAAPKLLINSRADVAVAIRADGVHLTAQPGSLTPGQVRSLYAAAGFPKPIVSVSCHTLDEVAEARDAGATLILFGPVFEKRIGEQLISAGTGLDLLRDACTAAAPVPVLALGGVTAENAAVALAAGAAGIAAIRLFQGESTPLLSPSS